MYLLICKLKLVTYLLGKTTWTHFSHCLLFLSYPVVFTLIVIAVLVLGNMVLITSVAELYKVDKVSPG